MSSVSYRAPAVPSVLGVLVLTLALAACSTSVVEDEAGPAAAPGPSQPEHAVTGTHPPQDLGVSQGRLTGEAIHEDPERFAALADRMRQEFPALAGSEGSAPVFHGLHLCSVLYADEANERDVRERYDHFLAGFIGDGYVSRETGQHWVERSIDEFCPDLQPRLTR